MAGFPTPTGMPTGPRISTRNDGDWGLFSIDN